MLMRDSGSPRPTTRISARSTSPRPGGLRVRLLPRRFLRTQTSQSTPASSESQFSAFFETVWGSDCCVMGKRGILRVTPWFKGKRGCRGSVRSCVLRHGSGESVAVVGIGLADDNIVDEQDISAPVPPRTRLLRNTPVRRTLPSDICSSYLLVIPGLVDVFLPNSISPKQYPL
ncbi:hypothetical protein WN943_022234 [Citrus x changshan-huyou]